MPSVLDEVGYASTKIDRVVATIYSPPKVGKTIFCCGAPKPLLLDYEEGISSLRNHPDLLITTQVLEMNNLAKLEAVLEAFRLGTHRIVEEVDTIIIDTFTTLRTKRLREIMKRAVAKNNQRNLYNPSENEYGEVSQTLNQLCLEFLDIPNKNIIFTAHHVEKVDKDSGQRLIRPQLPEAVINTVLGLSHVVGFLHTRQEKAGEVRYLQTRASSTVFAGSRLGELPPMIPNPHFDMILQAAGMKESAHGS